MSFSISGGYASIANIISGDLPTTTNLIPKANNVFTIGSSSSLQYQKIFAEQFFQNGGSVSSSDFNKKKEIQPIGDALSIIMQIKPKSFKMKNGTSNRTHTGFIAQECENLFCPNWAAYVKEGEDIGLRYEQFIALNTRSIQQINNRLANVEEFSKLASQKLDTDFSVITGNESKQNEMSTIYDRLNAIGNDISNLNSVKSDLSSIYSRLQLLESSLRNSLTEECICRINNMQNQIELKLENINPKLTEECICRVNNLQNQIDLKLENINPKLSEECVCRVNNLQNDIQVRLENIDSKLAQECQTRVNDMYGKISSEVDIKIEKEREKAREIEAVILNFQTKFNEQICDLIDKVNMLIEKCNELEKSRLVVEPENNIVCEVVNPLMSNLVDKVNFLIAKCDDIETFKDKYAENLRDNSREIQLLLNFENTFKQEMNELVSKVDLLSNELDKFNLQKQGESELINNINEKIHVLSGDINLIREKQLDSLREQSELNISLESSLKEQMLELVEKVNLLANDLEVIKQAVSTSSKEQKTEELDLINRLIDQINMLAQELQTIRDNQAQNMRDINEYKEEQKVTHSEEIELLNSLMEKVNTLMSDLESFRENVKQTVAEGENMETNHLNFEDKFRQQMLDLIEKVNSLVVRCNDLDLKLSNIPSPEKKENKIEFEDSDSCGSSMMETIQERLYKAEQLIGKQQKMITKLTSAVNSLLKANDNK